MRSATIRIHGSANDLLPHHRRHRPFALEFELPIGLRDGIQSTGIPWIELGPVHLNGDLAEPAMRIDDGDLIEAQSRYPLTRPPPCAAFVLDVHLGRLARYLRLFGFDTVHDRQATDPELVEQAVTESRILLTRDRSLLMRSALEHASFVRATGPRLQIEEVVDRFALREVATPFSRCLACNGLLRPLAADAAARRVPATVAESHTEFTTCPDCERVFWKGSHYRRLLAIVEHMDTNA